MIVLSDCLHHRGDMPCRPHKRLGVSCGACHLYAPAGLRVLIVKLGAPGDVLRTTCILPALRWLHPNAHVTWITRDGAVPLLEGNPSIDRVLTVESNYVEFLMSETFDLAINPDADHLSAAILTLVNATAKRGFVTDGRGGLRPLSDPARQWWHLGLDDTLKRQNRDTYGQWLYRICELDGDVQRPLFRIARDDARMAGVFLGQVADRPGRRICVNTGASTRWEEKRWKVGHYLTLLGLILRDEPDASVILIGGPLERDLNAQLLNADPRFIDGGTRSSVGYVAALLAAADWVLTPDSLCYHLATAVGTPAVCLVGPTAPWELDRHDANLVLHDARECIACYLPICPLSETCMDSLSAGHVWSAIQQSIDYSADQFQMRSAVMALDTQAQARLGELGVRSVA